ncbi:hypothetical protein [Rickettsia endosymbiont of Aspidapion aeneum]
MVKPRHDTETLCKNSSHATTLENGNLEKILLSHPEFISGYLGN